MQMKISWNLDFKLEPNAKNDVYLSKLSKRHFSLKTEYNLMLSDIRKIRFSIPYILIKKVKNLKVSLNTSQIC